MCPRSLRKHFLQKHLRNILVMCVMSLNKIMVIMRYTSLVYIFGGVVLILFCFIATDNYTF